MTARRKGIEDNKKFCIIVGNTVTKICTTTDAPDNAMCIATVRARTLCNQWDKSRRTKFNDETLLHVCYDDAMALAYQAHHMIERILSGMQYVRRQAKLNQLFIDTDGVCYGSITKSAARMPLSLNTVSLV
ncbi:hypothetical protein KIN20_026675 [Parelaphostrongylus tenuis]|uniref:Uncharacterized protein n=1 Tax=Parelaphostrongylus tenuis TaxID=148309 RepID=A0AAD5QYB3_PARTN|nr:hypothetical protein KIN20_026675 [Parelaphostrongylus tenuis]